MAGNVGGGRLGAGVVPGGILVDLVADHHMVVTGLAFPEAGADGLAGLEMLHVQAAGWKVAVAFHGFKGFGLGNHGVVPEGDRACLCF